jgi:hypothetical protein
MSVLGRSAAPRADMLKCMTYWSFIGRGSTRYVTEEPEVRSDGTVVSKGEIFPKGTKVKRHEGDPPERPSRGSVPPKAGRPNKIDKARGFGEGNTRLQKRQK